MKRIYRTALFSGAAFFTLPFRVWADGIHPAEKQAGISLGTYVLLAFTILLTAFAIVYALQKKQLDELAAVKRPAADIRERRVLLTKRVSILRWARLSALIGLLLTGALNMLLSQKSDESVDMTHIHGLGYSQDGEQLMFAAHDGIRILSQGQWTEGAGEKNDYMGFSVMDQGFYSSGHPALGSKMKNPFGIVRSLDGGKTVEPLAYYGEIDFHVMAAGYRSHALYVYNPQPLAQLKEQGIYFSPDEGKTWAKGTASGLSGEVTSIAAHPDQASTVAVGTSTGAYISRDTGKTFEALITGKQITGLSYDLEGKLLAGTYESKKAGLVQIIPDTKTVKEYSIPALSDDAVAFIAVQPKNKQEITFATYNRQAFTTTDGGTNWEHIVENGKSAK